MPSNRPHTCADEIAMNRNNHIPAIPRDVEALLLELEAEIGAEAYERWVDANVLDRDTWERIKRAAGRELEDIQGRRDQADLVAFARGQ